MKIAQLVVLLTTMLTTIAIAQAPADDSILVDEYIVSQEFIEAKVLQVRPIARTLTVRGENRGQTRQFTVPENTRITVNGRPARLRDIQRGDTVLLAMVPEAEEVVISRLRVPETDVTLEQRRAEPVVAESRPAMLPKTASPWPTVLLIGLLSMLAAGSLRLVRRYY